MKTMRQILALTLIVAISGAAPAPERKKRLLIVGQSKGYQHEAISTAMVTLYNLGRRSGQWETYFRTDCTAITSNPIGPLPPPYFRSFRTSVFPGPNATESTMVFVRPSDATTCAGFFRLP